MTVDTTVTNGRFVDPDGVTEHAISIHGGIVLERVELDDVWRTIDASGHLVLPGLIQPGSLAANELLSLAQQGTTVMMALNQRHEPAPASPIDLLRCIDLDGVGNEDDLDQLLSSGQRVFSTEAPRPDLGNVLAGGILRLGSDGLVDWNWLDLDRNRLVVPATHPDAAALARSGNAMLEVSGFALSEDGASDIWDPVADENLPVHVTNGGIPDFPLLQFLFYEGCQTRSITPSRIAAVVSAIPAQWYGLCPEKGSFLPGSHGDVVVFDPVTPDPYRNSPWPGRVILSIQRGNVLLYNGQLHTSAGDGLLLNG